MPSIVTINSAGSDLSLLAGHSGTLSFDVANTSGRLLTLRARILDAEGQELPPWLNLSDGAELSLVAGETAPVTIAVTPPPGVETTRSLQLEVFEVALPEENVDRSAPVGLSISVPEGEPEPEPEPRSWLVPILAVAGVLVLAAGAGLFWLLRDPGLPDVTGLTFAEAQEILTEAGARRVETEKVLDASQPTGTVIAQHPAAGSANPGDLIVEVEVVAVSLPGFRSQEFDVALGFILDHGLKLVGPVRRNSATVPVDHIVGTDPAEGTLVTAGDAVTVQLSTGEAGGGIVAPGNFTGPAIQVDPGVAQRLQEAMEANPDLFDLEALAPQLGIALEGIRVQQ